MFHNQSVTQTVREAQESKLAQVFEGYREAQECKITHALRVTGSMPSVTLRNVLTFLGNRMSKNDVNHLWEKRKEKQNQQRQ